MSVLAVAVKHLVALGMAGDALASAIAEMQAAEDMRSTGARRTARYRERHKSSQSVTCDANVTDETDVTLGFLDKEKSPTPSKEIKPSRVCEPHARDYHRLPTDWEPTRPLSDGLAEKVALWPPTKISDALDGFRSWAANAENKNGKGKKLDWDTAWQNWLRRVSENWNGGARAKQQWQVDRDDPRGVSSAAFDDVFTGMGVGAAGATAIKAGSGLKLIDSKRDAGG